MKKLLSLIKVSLSHDMNIFKINTRKPNKFTKILPILLTLYLMFILGTYSAMLMDKLKPMHLEFITLTLFGLAISILTFMEGIYKSGQLLFNCKDDNMLLSLPIKKSTVLFIRFFKFYIFELLYNSLFILPAMIIYAVNVIPNCDYYLTSFIALFLLPIIPIILSCIIGFIITYLSSIFKGKNIFQTIFTMTFLLAFLYLSFNMDRYITNIVEKATSINDFVVKLYYPVGAYISLVNNFNILKLCIYLLIHLGIVFVMLFILGKIYFKINSNSKRILTSHKSKKYIMKRQSKVISFIKKELNRFFFTPVFITNAGFGLILFIIACASIAIKFDSIIGVIASANLGIDISMIQTYLPAIMFGVVCFGSVMTSITSSMISLEGNSFNILKSLPLKPVKIVLYKVLAALVIMIPCIFIGDIIIFIRFKFKLISIILILLASILLPLVTELIGIIINLKYPKMDASNDTEVVKQSMSSLISTFIGMGLLAVTVFLIFNFIDHGFNSNLIILLFIGIYGLICLILLLILSKNCTKDFNNINI